MSNVTSPKLLKSCSAELATKLSIRGGLNVGRDEEGDEDVAADADADAEEEDE